ncbi:MAG: hypothetical protein A3K18_14425 [Lentisphaerae bacterium RIFOXYA12_64_32]|nr:MAG: hypothetical protein A3K18_14425 [Lentisphaerae bacterium RIFOXYA12_64_32]
MKQVGPKNLYSLESLEPRLLLSGETPLDAAAADLQQIPDVIVQAGASAELLNQQIPVLGQSIADLYNPAAQIQDLFAGLGTQNFQSPQDLATALDARPGVDATCATDGDGGFSLDVSVNGNFSTETPFQLTPEMTGDAEFAFAGDVRINGLWSLKLRILGDGQQDPQAALAIDPDHSGLLISLTVDEAGPATGTLGATQFDAGAPSLVLQAAGEVTFLVPAGHDRLLLQDIATRPASEFTRGNLTGHATLTAQLTETLNASNSPPVTLSLEWSDIQNLLTSGSNLADIRVAFGFPSTPSDSNPASSGPTAGGDSFAFAVAEISRDTDPFVIWEQTTDTDFGAGTLTNVSVSGTGSDASLTLTGFSFAYRRELTIHNYGDALSGYQLNVILSAVNFDFARTQADGDDIRFMDTDDTTPLSFWTEAWDAEAQTASIWVNVPTLAASSAKTIYLHFGNPDATDAASFDNTFGKNDAGAGLVAWYHMDEGTGTTLTDSSGNSHTGTLQSGPTWQSADGGGWGARADVSFGTGSYLSFDGTNDYVDLGSWFTYQDFTIGMWVKPSATQTAYATLIDNNHTDSQNWELQQNVSVTNNYVFGPAAGGGGGALCALTSGTWQYVTLTRDSGTGTNQLYVNGALVDSAVSNETTAVYANQYLRLARWGGGSRYWTGAMDELQIYNRVLTQPEIEALGERRQFVTDAPTVTVQAETSAAKDVYITPGTFVSAVFDTTSDTADYLTLRWTATTPAATMVRFQLRSADTAGGVSAATWYGPTSTSDYYTVTDTLINATNDLHRYVQWRVELSTTDVSATPVLNDVSIDYGNAFPAPLDQVTPAGSLVWHKSVSPTFADVGAFYYTLSLDAGQKVSLSIVPQDLSLQPGLELLSPAGASLSAVTASAAGQPAVLQNLAVATTGVYTLKVSNQAGTGVCTVDLWLNAALESEELGGTANDTPGTAQSMGESTLALGTTADRLAVIGATNGGSDDYYSFALSENQRATMAVNALDGGTVSISLYDANDNLLAMGMTGASNVTQFIRNFKAPTTGTYLVQVRGTTGVVYNLLVTRDATFDLEPNSSPDSAGGLDSDSLVVLGALKGGAATENEPNDSIATANDMTSSFSATGGNTYTGQATGSISTGTDADYFVIQASPGDSIVIDQGNGTLNDTYLYLYNRSGTQLAADDDAGPGYWSRITYTFGNANSNYAGEYYIRADAYSSGTGTYVLDVVLTTTTPLMGPDYYSFAATAGDVVTISTATPGDDAGEPVNTLNPSLTLFDSSGTQVAFDDNSGADGRNALLTYTIATTGVHRVKVAGAAGQGDYVLAVTGATGATSAVLTGTASSPANAATVTPFPATYRIDFSQPIRLDNVSASSLTVNGIAATGVSIVDGDSLLLDIAAADQGDATYTVTLAEGAASSVSGDALSAFSATFTVDRAGPRVTAQTPASTSDSPFSSIAFTFSRDINAATFTAADVVSFTGPGSTDLLSAITTVTGAGTDFTVTFNAQSLPGVYTMVLGPDIRDQVGNQMDQNDNGTSGEVGDTYTAIVTVQAPDLTIAGTVPTSANAGDQVEVSWTVTNSGAYDATKAWLDGVYFSVDGTFSADDTLLLSEDAAAHSPLAPAGFYTVTKTVTIPAWATGNPYLILVTDRTLTQGETDNTNNTYAAQILLDHVGPRVAGIDPRGTTNTAVSTIRVLFNEAIDPSTFTADDVTLTGPGGAVALAAQDPIAQVDARTFDITLAAPQTLDGTYTLTVGPDIADVYENAMDQGSSEVSWEPFSAQPVDMNLIGSAAWNAGGVLRLTPNSSSQTGGVFFQTPATAGAFEVEFDLTLAASGSAAEGMTFVVSDQATAIGGTGANLGYRNLAGKSFAVEFDVYNSGSGTYYDTNNNHIAIDWNGQFQNTMTAVPQSFVGTGTFHVLVTFDGTDLVTVTLRQPNGSGVQLSTHIATSAVPAQMYFGFTGATSGWSASQDVDNVTLRLDPTAVGDPAYQGTFTLDTTVPEVTDMSPTGTVNYRAVQSIDVTFSKSMAVASFQTTDFTLTGPDGAVTITSITKLSDTQYRVNFASQTVLGTYTLNVGPDVTDTVGSPMSNVYTGTLTTQVVGPYITAITPSGNTNDQNLTALMLTLSGPVVADGANSATTYTLLSLGANRAVGGGDDTEITATPAYTDGTTEITLNLASALPEGLYQLTARNGATCLRDANGLPLDQTRDGIGDDYVTALNVDFTAPTVTGVYAGTALSFDGTNDYLVTPNLKSLFTDNSMTIELWFNATSAGVIASELSTATPNSSSHDSQIEILSTGEVKVRVWNLTAVSLGKVNFGEWHQVVLRYNRTTQVLDGFLDGVEAATDSSGIRSVFSSEYYAFGAADSTNLGSGAFFKGRIDEIRIWNTARAAEDIQADMGHTLTGTESGLMAYYRLDSGTGSTAYDATANAKNATLGGAAGTQPAWSTNPAPIASRMLTVLFNDVSGMDQTSGTNVANYQLSSSGGDGVFGNGDDVLIGAPTGVSYNASLGLAVLTFASDFTDEFYQLTIVGAGGVTDVAGNEVGDGAGYTSGALPVAVTATTVTADLQAASDSGSSSTDNLTNVTSPTFDVTVNKPGTIEVDFTNDGTFDTSLVVDAPSTYSFTPSTAYADGTPTVNAKFTPWVGEAVSSSLQMTIDTHGPQVTAVSQVLLLPCFQSSASFSEAVDPASFTVDDTWLTGSTRTDLGTALSITGSGTSFAVNFTPLTTAGDYTLTLGPDIRDLAGNQMDQNSDGTNGTPELDIYTDSFSLVGSLTPGLWVTRLVPTGGTGHPFDKMEIVFSQPVQDDTFTADDVQLTDATGATINLVALRKLGPQWYELDFSGLTGAAIYTLSVGPNILSDPAGQAMNQDHDATPGEAADDAFVARLVATAANIGELDTSYDGKNLIVYGVSVLLDGTRSLGGVELLAGSTLTHSATSSIRAYQMAWTIRDLLWIDSTSKIDVSGMGQIAGRGVGFRTSTAPTTMGGGSYGGLGSIGTSGGATNSAYGDYLDPAYWGTGGGATESGGAGGGLVRISTGTALLSGSILANGGNAHQGGSGGAIKLTVGTLLGAGTISANGGNTTHDGGSGGGGRVAIYYDTLDAAFDVSKVTAHGGSGWGEAGAVGTVYLKNDSGEGVLRLDSHSTTAGRWTPLGTSADSAFTVDRLVLNGSGVVAAPEHQMPLQVGNLDILNGAMLTHQATTTTQAYSLLLTVTDDLTIDSTSKIDVSNRGYLIGRTLGNTTSGAAAAHAGGSYGGYGSSDSGATNATYGDFSDPNELGSGGGTTWSNGGSGGGLARITVGGTATINGSISANGGDGWTNNNAAGSGGGIRLSAGTLAGSGTLSANGGNGVNYYSLGGSGGGGRIAVYYDTVNGFDTATKVTAHGGTGGAGSAAVGTVYFKDNAGEGELRVDSHGAATGVWTPIGSSADSAVAVDRLVITGSGVVAAPEHQLSIQAGRLDILNGAMLTHPTTTATQAYSLLLTVTGNLTLDSTSTIDVSNRGYLIGRTNGNSTSGAATRMAGGSYGGLGSDPADGDPNWVYGDYRDPNELGSGGGTAWGSGGSGGGLVRLSVGGTATINGSILANGGSGWAGGNAAGSGGGIMLSVGALAGSGTISTNGGNGVDWYSQGGSGGGGRIAVYHNTIDGFDTSTNITANGGNGGVGAAAVGTVYLKDNAGEGVLRIDSHGAATGMWTPLGQSADSAFAVDRLVITGSGVVAAPEHQMPIQANNVEIRNSSILTHRVTTAAQEYSLTLTITGSLIIDSTSTIDVSNRGYLIGRTLGNATAGAAANHAGGSYGGYGSSDDGSTNAVYGSYPEPNELGSGGGTTWGGGGSGGGLARITVTGTATLDGSILANGGSGWAGGNAAGSGGGIMLNVGTLTGSGTISANGGNGVNWYALGGSGGGGRIAIYYNDASGFDITTQVTAHGGTGGAGAAAVGSVYLKQNGGSGVLRLDSHGASTGVWTPLGISSDAVLQMDRLVISGNGVVAAPEHDMVLAANDVTLQNSAVLTHRYVTATQEFGLRLNITGDLTIDASAMIDVSNRGYLIGRTFGNTTSGAAAAHAGGSYGGYGSSDSGATNAVYGSYLDPNELGSGGGTSWSRSSPTAAAAGLAGTPPAAAAPSS